MKNKTISDLYWPAKWTTLTPERREAIRSIDRAIAELSLNKLPDYRSIADFKYTARNGPPVRQAISDAIGRRTSLNYSMTQESICIAKIENEYAFSEDNTVYELATAVRRVLFGKQEPLRKFNVGILYHPGLIIAPPRMTDPIFQKISAFGCDSAIYTAVQIFHLILSAHPFSDGNGRVSRIVFNLILRRQAGSKKIHIPINALVWATNGIHEECLSLGHYGKGHDAAVELSLDVCLKYCEFWRTRTRATQTSELSQARQFFLNSRNADGTSKDNINLTPPYILSMKEIVSNKNDVENNAVFLDAINGLGKELASYGKIEYAITTLNSLTDSQFEKKSVTYFLSISRKEDLLLRAREMRARYKQIPGIEFAAVTGDVVANSKILLNVASHYQQELLGSDDCLIILRDLNF